MLKQFARLILALPAGVYLLLAATALVVFTDQSLRGNYVDAVVAYTCFAVNLVIFLCKHHEELNS